MPALVAGIHVFLREQSTSETWMAGTSPDMTKSRQPSSFSRRIRVRAMPASTVLPRKGEAERRETPGCAKPRGRPAKPPGTKVPRALAIGRARLPALGLRCFSIPGHAFGAARLAPPSAGSRRGDLSVSRVEPRIARDRHACRPREPRREPLGSPRKYQRRIFGAFLRPAPPKRCLARAPQVDGLSVRYFDVGIMSRWMRKYSSRAGMTCELVQPVPTCRIWR
jgi:hypothetical protein